MAPRPEPAPILFAGNDQHAVLAAVRAASAAAHLGPEARWNDVVPIRTLRQY